MTDATNFFHTIALAGVHAHLAGILRNQGPDAQRLEAERLEGLGWDDDVLDARFGLDPILTGDHSSELWSLDLSGVSIERLQELSVELADLVEDAALDGDWDLVERCDARRRDLDEAMVATW